METGLFEGLMDEFVEETAFGMIGRAQVSTVCCLVHIDVNDLEILLRECFDLKLKNWDEYWDSEYQIMCLGLVNFDPGDEKLRILRRWQLQQSLTMHLYYRIDAQEMNRLELEFENCVMKVFLVNERIDLPTASTMLKFLIEKAIRLEV